MDKDVLLDSLFDNRHYIEYLAVLPSYFLHRELCRITRIVFHVGRTAGLLSA